MIVPRLWIRVLQRAALASLVGLFFITLVGQLSPIVSYHTQSLSIYVNRRGTPGNAKATRRQTIAKHLPTKKFSQFDVTLVIISPQDGTKNIIGAHGSNIVTVVPEKWKHSPDDRDNAVGYEAGRHNHSELFKPRSTTRYLVNRSSPVVSPAGVMQLGLPFIRKNTPKVLVKGSHVHNVSKAHKTGTLVNETAKGDKRAAVANKKTNASKTNGTALPKIPAEYGIIDPAKKKRVLVLAYFRSGSSFLGGLLSSASNRTFFSYEPLSLLTPAERLDSRMSPIGLDILENHLTCQFTRMRDYLATAFRRWNHYIPNAFLMELCGRKMKVCLNPQFMSDACRRSPFQVIKVTRLSVADVLQRLRLNESLRSNLKVLHLVRDPRGMLSSRNGMSWCRKSKICLQARYLCQEMQDDLDAFEQLKHVLPNGTVSLRYEDIAESPLNQSMALFQALGLEFSDAVVKFLKTHTSTDDVKALRNPYSTVRRSSVAAFSWTKKLTWDRVKEIQVACAEVLKRLRYKVYGSYDELKKMSP